MKIVTKKDVTPICPHCDAKLHEVIRIADAKLMMNKGYCYICPDCHKVLGFADWSA